MRILHCCFDFSFMDDWGYQENLLSEMHQRLGHEVCVLTSTISQRPGTKAKYYEPGSYCLKNGVKIIRVPPRGIPRVINKRLKLLKGIYEELSAFQPDIIFLHNAANGSIYPLIQYLKDNPGVKLLVDSHADYINSSKNLIVRTLLYKGLYRHFYAKILPYTTTFFGTLPIRCDFLRDVYNVPADKIRLLVMGFDDSSVPYERAAEIRDEVRKEYGIEQGDFVLVTGGKIDRRKNIFELMRAVKKLPYDNTKLLIFGDPAADLKDEFQNERSSERIKAIGWIDSSQIYKIFFASDLAFFPGTHSVLWEQSVACGLPAVFKRWYGITHIDLGGNCVFLDEVNENTIEKTITELYENSVQLNAMKNVAKEKGREAFSYLQIARQAIADCI